MSSAAYNGSNVMPKALLRLKTVVIAVLTFLMLMPAVFARQTEDTFFVSDKADVLSPETEAEIIEKGEVILAQSGCKIAVATVDFLGGKEIEQVCRELYLENEMGNNGILLLFSVAEENYHVIQGEALKNALTDSELKEIFDDCVEKPFDSGEYSKAAEAAYREIVARIENIYSITSDKERYLQQLKEIELLNQKTAKMKKIYSAVLAGSVLVALLFLIRMAVSFNYYFKHRRR